MRIGQFAEKYKVTQDTVRYYIERGLLVASKRGEQFFFTESDGQDLMKILELKELDFSLNCIQDILMTQRLSGENSDVYRQRYLTCLKEKQEQVDEDILKYEALRQQIHDTVQQLELEDNQAEHQLGVPLTALGILTCPSCGNSLNLAEGSLVENMIMEASLSCPCGFKAQIHKGVYIDKAAVRPKLLGNEPMPTKEEFLASSSHTFVNYLYQTLAAMVKLIKVGSEPSYILELSNCVGFFLMQYIQDLPVNSTYVLVDYDLDRLMRMKGNLEMYYSHRKFLFLCCDYEQLPLAKGSIDCMVDNGMSRTYQLEEKKYLPPLIVDRLKDQGTYVSSSIFFGENSKGNPQTIEPLGWYKEEGIEERIKSVGLTIEDTLRIGPVFQEESAQSNFSDMELYQLVARSIKTSISK